MLRIIQNKAAESAKRYFSRSDYLSEGQELTGHWGGRAAQLLGLSGEVEQLHFERMCDNQHPMSGEKLTLRQKSERTTGWDVNFHVPKGVSIAYALGEDERIMHAFRSSVEETMQEMETEARTRVRKHGQDSVRTTGNLAWATFVHLTARPVDGIPDPHLHAHCFVPNVSWDSKENAWKAVSMENLKTDAPYYEAAFHARMAFRMRELGYEIKREGKSWDIATIPKEVRDKFKRRTDQIEQIAAKEGIVNPLEKSNLGARSRESKQKQLSMPELRKIWLERLSGSEQDAMNAPLPQADRVTSLDTIRHDETKAMRFALSHCFENHSVVPQKVLLGEALRHGVGNVTVAGIRRQSDLQHVIRREVEGRVLATTHEVLAEEREMLRFARGGLGEASPLNPNWTIQRDWLNEDQRAAVQHVLNAPDRLMMIRGGAGVGKTSLMQEAVAGIEANGTKVFTFAPSSRASRDVLRSEGFDATTVAELLNNKELQQKIEGQAVWIDEAGLLGSITLKKVTDLAQQKNARVILSGDWRQHGSVERGAAMRLLEQEGGIQPAIVRHIQRQTGAYREAVALLAEGNTLEGMHAINRLGWIREINDADTRYTEMAKEFAEILKSGETVLATAPTHAEGDRLTESIRGELREQGYIQGESHSFLRLKKLQLTKAEKEDGERLAEADILAFHQNAKGIRKGQRIDAKSPSAKALRKHAARFDAYQRQEMKLAVGDLVRISQNGKTCSATIRSTV